MKLEYLNEFITLSETKNYSVCADALYISQPSLTRHIQELEKELGVPLFERAARGVVLTEEGNIFIPYARELLNIKADYTDALQKHKEKKNGTITIGTVHAMPQYGISRIIGAWSAENPQFKLKILENDSRELFTMLRQGTISCAFAREDYSDINGDFERIKITSDRLVCLVPEGHPRAKDKTISIRELKDEKILYYEQSTMMRSLFLGAGFTIPDASIGAKGRNALLLVKQGLGIMLEFRKPIDDSELGGFAILDIEPEVRSDINFVYLPHALSDTGRRFVNFIKHYVRTNPPQA